MTQDKIAQYFDDLTTNSQALAKDADISLTDALIELLEDVANGQVAIEDGKPTPAVAEQIEKFIAAFDWRSMSPADLRKTLQLAILKVTRDDHTQANFQITPDGIGYLLADFLLQTADLKSGDTILDMTVGAGNLLQTVNDVLKMNDLDVKRIGIDNDETQLALATAVDQLLTKGTTTFYESDVVALTEMPKAKAVIADLPVGYYPLEPAESYQTRNQDDRSFVHHLLIEKSLEFATDDGWVYLIVPANVMMGDQAKDLLKFLTQKAQLKAFLQLSAAFFKDPRAAKAILVLRKHGVGRHGEVLMGQYPPLKDIEALQKFLQDIKAWVKLDKEQNKA
ncbi:class I SAM-dependent methyltransferase [Leuconostoc lactis]|uniref:class I SAM-dependent methyltransferase n=1 Tax=Leuconostoc lactis TaxID=1246 RepID=UPI00265CE923|nr:class I SAM-dependent methyltransferase [Leuconostoc lactis]